MKLLTIALDGGDERVLRAFDLPFFNDLFEDLEKVSIEADLFSRGWAESFIGLDGSITGALYSKATLNSRREATQKFGMEGYNRFRERLLWNRLSQEYRVGIYNLNTVMPAEKVDGFFVAGPGGGFKAGRSIPVEACYPPEIHKEIENEYWEIRFRSSGITEEEDFFEEIKRAITSRVNGFIRLQKMCNVDFGFIFHKAPVVIQNLFGYDISRVMNNEDIENKRFQNLRGFYRHLGAETQRLIEEIGAEGMLIYSDHGFSPMRKKLNINRALSEAGFLKERSLQTLRKGQYILRKRWMKRLPRMAPRRSLTDLLFDFGKSKAFTVRYVPGVYLDDQRFGGPQYQEADRLNVLDEICDGINGIPELRENSICFNVVSGEFERSPYYPDIISEVPEWIFPENSGRAIVYENPEFKSINSLSTVKRDMTSGFKGRTPLFFLTGNFKDDIVNDRKVTSVYKTIEKIFRLAQI